MSIKQQMGHASVDAETRDANRAGNFLVERQLREEKRQHERGQMEMSLLTGQLM